MSRDDRQARVYEWCVATFGCAGNERRERALRLVEEAMEVAQAEGLEYIQVRDLLSYVYAKAPGNPASEAGGVGTTLLAYCAALGISANKAEKEEWDRVREFDAEYFRER